MNCYSNSKAWWWGILIWKSMCIHGHELVCKAERGINQHHCHEILEQNVCRIIQKFHLDTSRVIFQQDNVHIHTT